MPRLGLTNMLPKFLSWIPRGPQQAAYTAALGLVAIQVGIGVVLKASQNPGGKYSFSPSASVTISEFFKMLLSTIFFYNECRRRAADGIGPSTRGHGTGYAPLASELPTAERQSLDTTEGRKETNGHARASAAVERQAGHLPRMSFRAFWSYIRGEVTVDVRYGFCNLALFYVLINNSIFVIYKLADPGTVQLMRSGVTFITALVMIATLGTKISQIQWIAIILQICGLMVTQYDPLKGTAYPLGTYVIILVQVFLSASSGVYNQALLKTDDSSLHADNMVLYGAGAAINFLSHIVVAAFKADEPGFFSGYNTFGAVMVIVNNVFIGLAITAVYKYADAVIKCFATAFATGILLYISPILFGNKLGFLVIPGSIVVFAASWLYMDNPPPKEPQLPAGGPQKLSLPGKVAAVSRKYNKTVLCSATVFTVIVVAFLTMFDTKLPDKKASVGVSGPMGHSSHSTGSKELIKSPFANTLAMIRWNSARPERVPLLMKYQPFFHTVHISMPGMFWSHGNKFHNLTHDQFPNTFLVYKEVAKTMKLILDEQPEIDGLMFYHFDAWLHPLQFSGNNPYSIWFLNTIDIAPPSGGGPNFMCMTDKSKYDWWGWGHDMHKAAIAASEVVSNFGLEYTINKGEWCVGWSDIYYIPRRFFADFIFLAEIFGGFGVFHEVAIPTIVHIIDQSRRRNPYHSVIDLLGDCWGSCCATNPTIENVLWSRCGHRLDYLKEPVAHAFFNALDEQAKLIGQPLNNTQYAVGDRFDPSVFNSKALAGLNKGDPKGVRPLKEDGLEDDERARKLVFEEKEKARKDTPEDPEAPPLPSVLMESTPQVSGVPQVDKGARRTAPDRANR